MRPHLHGYNAQAVTTEHQIVRLRERARRPAAGRPAAAQQEPAGVSEETPRTFRDSLDDKR